MNRPREDIVSQKTQNLIKRLCEKNDTHCKGKHSFYNDMNYKSASVFDTMSSKMSEMKLFKSDSQ